MKYYTTFKSVPPRYNWNIVESGVKYHNPNHINMCENEQLTIICSYRIKKRMQFCYVSHTSTKKRVMEKWGELLFMRLEIIKFLVSFALGEGSWHF